VHHTEIISAPECGAKGFHFTLSPVGAIFERHPGSQSDYLRNNILQLAAFTAAILVMELRRQQMNIDPTKRFATKN
jgi:hypothetical protein